MGLINRLKDAVRAFRGKPVRGGSIEFGIDMKYCDKCEYKTPSFDLIKFADRLKNDEVHMIGGFDYINKEFDVTFMKNEGPTRTYSVPMDKLIYTVNDADKVYWLERFYEHFKDECEKEERSE